MTSGIRGEKDKQTSVVRCEGGGWEGVAGEERREPHQATEEEEDGIERVSRAIVTVSGGIGLSPSLSLPSPAPSKPRAAAARRRPLFI